MVDVPFYEKTLPVLRGQMGKHVWYVASIKLDDLSRLFNFDTDIAAEDRAQRELKPAKVKGISEYIQDNIEEYVFSALAAYTTLDIEFSPFEEDFGRIHVSTESGMFWLDGQHRWAGICNAILKAQALKKDSVPVIIFPKTTLISAKQMFSDINGNGSRPNKSVVAGFNLRDENAIITEQLIKEVPIFRNFTDGQRTNLKKSSPCLFARSALYDATKILTKNLASNQAAYVKGFWKVIALNIPVWGQVLKGTDPREVRLKQICTHNITILALAEIGSQISHKFRDNKDKTNFKEMEVFLLPLKGIDWYRTNPDWETRILSHTKAIQANSQNLKRLVIYLKFFLGMHLDKEEIQLENALSDLLQRPKTPAEDEASTIEVAAQPVETSPAAPAKASQPKKPKEPAQEAAK
jgi:DNA sulfur modification protein DndB